MKFGNDLENYNFSLCFLADINSYHLFISLALKILIGHHLTNVNQSSIRQRHNQMIPTIDFAIFVQRCKAAHDVRNLPLCTVYVVLLLPS